VNFDKKIVSTVIKTFIVTVLLTVVLALWLFSKYGYTFEKLGKVLSVIEESYVGEYDLEKCEEGAINGLLEALGDNYAVYYNEENAQETMQLIEGYYVGVGIEVFANIDKGYIEVVSAFEDSPAYRAGIKGGDLIKSIDGIEYDISQMAEAISYMKGANIEGSPDKEIEIGIIRNGEEITVKLKREKIDMYKVTQKIDDDICYIRYSGFTADSLKCMEKMIENLNSNIRGLVIDIRDNPGGEFGSAIDMCDMFMDEGLIMYTVDKNGKKVEYFAKEGSFDIPVAVLVNGYSASASEIFAGSMQANGRAVIVGEKTYGKGVAQTVKYLNPFDKSEGALKLTTCKNYTPDGRWINECIIPDVVVENTDIEEDITKDPVFIEAVKSLKKDK